MSQTAQSTPARVLILDTDDDLVRRLADHLSARRAARVFVATDAATALETHLRTPCDVLVAGVEPEGTDFATLATRFRLMGDPRIIALCAAPEPRRLLELVRLRVHDVLVQPFAPRDVERSVRRELAQRRRRLMHRRRARLLRDELRRMRLRGKALEHRLDVLSRDVVTAYQRLAGRLGE